MVKCRTVEEINLGIVEQIIEQKPKIVEQKKKVKHIVKQSELHLYPFLISNGYTYNKIQKLKFIMREEWIKQLKLVSQVKYVITVENVRTLEQETYERVLSKIGNKSVYFAVPIPLVKKWNLKYGQQFRIIKII